MTVTLKLSKKKVLLTVLLVAVVAAAFVTCRMFLQSDTVSAWLSKGPRGSTEEERQEFIASLGWQVDPEPAEVVELVVPKEFDDVYTAYNDMQKDQGYDLTKHMGKRAKRYTYVVYNYPGYEGGVRLNLVVRGNRVIAGDVCSLEIDGFMHGFALPTGEMPPLGASPAPQIEGPAGLANTM